MTYSIPRIVIAATQSGSGKTTLVTGLLGALRSMGLKVQSYKIGPDYIDPGYHALASGRPAHNLDSWLLPKERIKKLFAETAKTSDIAVIEGVMGLYDGGRKGISSTAEIAKLINAPVLLVIDSKSMGASAAAIALGFRAYDPEVKLAGVLLNRLGSSTHEAMIREALEKINIPVFGAVRRDDSLAMPERHLGLLPTEENQDRELINRIAAAIGKQIDLKAVLALAQEAEPMEIVIEPPAGSDTVKPKDTEKCRIAVARDEAFSFYYPESLKVLEQYGAEIITFSPLNDATIP
ncbi:MAG TPA: cobyrinate a,c-diamide synthase, partial [Selenomonas sp.]|nr:cobyrinate a,c-diamide synthase [Selenomonas sp.]